jgi:hypothetical protein
MCTVLLPPGVNTIAVKKIHHIISYNIISYHIISYHIISYSPLYSPLPPLTFLTLQQQPEGYINFLLLYCRSWNPMNCCIQYLYLSLPHILISFVKITWLVTKNHNDTPRLVTGLQPLRPITQVTLSSVLVFHSIIWVAFVRFGMNIVTYFVCVYIYIYPLEEQCHNSKNAHFELCPQGVCLRPYLPSGIASHVYFLKWPREGRSVVVLLMRLHHPSQWLFLSPEKLYFSSCDSVLLGVRYV